MSTVSKTAALSEKGQVFPDGPHKPDLMAAVHRLLDLIGEQPLDASLEFALNQR